MRILIVSDSRPLAERLSKLLRSNGWQPAAFLDAAEGLDEALSSIYDAAIVDSSLPAPGALWLLRELRREEAALHVLILAAAGAKPSERVALLDAGADLCLIKDFDRLELSAQLRALFRRRTEIYEGAPAFGDLLLDTDSGLLICGDGNVRLDRTELELMRQLLLAGGTPLSKETLLIHVRGYNTEAQPSIVETYISVLRKKLRLLCSGVRIETVWRRGYRLVLPADSSRLEMGAKQP